VKTVTEAHMLHSNSYVLQQGWVLFSVYTVYNTALLFAVKYKLMTLWLNTTIDSSTLSGLLHLI